MAEPNVLPVAEAARLLGITAARVRQLMDTGELGWVPFQAGGRLPTTSSVQRLKAGREARRAARAK